MKKIMVIGDLMLDEYIWGDVTRMSPEAPVPVVRERIRTATLGGAGNVLNNLHGLGAEVFFCGVVGCDAPAETIYQQFRMKKISSGGLIEDTRSTTVKTRIMSSGQQVLRVDNEDHTLISDSCLIKVSSYIRAFADQVDAFVVSDYNKGMIVPEVMDELRDAAGGKFIICDPKPSNIKYFDDVTCVSPNKKEAMEICGHGLNTEDEIMDAGEYLLNSLCTDYALITLGEGGMVLFSSRAEPKFIETEAQEVFDVSGAGDTVVATFTYGLCTGLTPLEAAKLANKAAGIVVSERGTSYITKGKLYADSVS